MLQTNDQLTQRHAAVIELGIFLGTYTDCALSKHKPILTSPGEGLVTVNLSIGSQDFTYNVMSGSDSDVCSWITAIFQYSHTRNNGSSTVWVMVDTDLYPSGLTGFSEEKFKQLLDRFTRSSRNLKVMLKSTTDDLEQCLGHGDRVIVCTPLSDDGSAFALAYYEPEDLREKGVSLPEYVGLMRETENGDQVCAFAQRGSVPQLKSIKTTINHLTGAKMAKQKKPKPDDVFDSLRSFMNEGDELATLLVDEVDGEVFMTSPFKKCRFSRVNYLKAVASIVGIMKETSESEVVVVTINKPLNDSHMFYKAVYRTVGVLRDAGISTVSAPPLGVNGVHCVTFQVGVTDDVLVVHLQLAVKNDDTTTLASLFLGLRSDYCLIATPVLESIQVADDSQTAPWEDEKESTTQYLDRKMTEVFKTPVKTGTLFLLEQNGVDDRQRIDSVRQRLSQAFKTVEIDVIAELQLQEKLSCHHKPLKDMIRDTLLQGKSVAVLWRSDVLTGDLSNLAVFAAKVTEWVEMAREIKAPHYYVGTF